MLVQRSHAAASRGSWTFRKPSSSREVSTHCVQDDESIRRRVDERGRGSVVCGCTHLERSHNPRGKLVVRVRCLVGAQPRRFSTILDCPRQSSTAENSIHWTPNNVRREIDSFVRGPFCFMISNSHNLLKRGTFPNNFQRDVRDFEYCIVISSMTHEYKELIPFSQVLSPLNSLAHSYFAIHFNKPVLLLLLLFTSSHLVIKIFHSISSLYIFP